MRALREWIDRDWERRRYIATFAFAQKVLWISPLLAIGLICWLLGAGPGDVLYDWGFLAGIVLCLVAMGFSLYRWAAGYSRTAWQEGQTRRRR